MQESSAHKDISLIFFGSPDFALPSLEALFDKDRIKITAVISQPEKERGRGKKVKPTPISVFAKSHNITLFEPLSLRNVNWDKLTAKAGADPELIRFIEFLNLNGVPDFAIVVAYGKLIPEGLIKLAKHDFLNVHPSSLPKWRGAAPLQRTLIAGDSTSSVCIMRLTKELDAGPVYLKQDFAVHSDETLQELHDRTALLGAELLVKTVCDIVDKNITPNEQELEDVTYAKKIEPHDTKIDWTTSAQEIHNLIRGLSPQPGAQTILGERNFKILRSTLSEGAGLPTPGALSVDKKQKKLLVSCGTNSLIEILELKPEGKGVISARDFINGLQNTEDLKFS